MMIKLGQISRVLIRVAFALSIAMLLWQCSTEKESSNKGSLAIIPKPVELTAGEGFFILDKSTTLYVNGDENIMKISAYLDDLISSSSSFQLKKVSETVDKNVITFEIDSLQKKKESYSIIITKDQIKMVAADVAGLFYAVQSFRQILPSAIEQKTKQVDSWQIPTVTIHDEPAFTWRGMHLDVSRHFFSVEFIKQFIDRVAFYKFNKLHLHLTDDQGWRLQIKKYPELTEKGAWRILNNQDSACLKRAEVNSDFALPDEFFKEKDGVKLYGGFYTQEEMKAIIDYASSRFITIIPEIDMPGHMNAAITSSPELTCVDQGGWGKLFTTPLCPCEETTYDFVHNILTEVSALFPGEYIHIGADEVDETSWLKSPACKELMKKNGWKTTKELHSYFVNRVNKMVTGLHKKAIGWDEVVDGVVDTSITVMYWRGWMPKVPALATSRGHKIIMSPTSHCYFDYEPDDRTLESMYSFDPIQDDIAANYRNKVIGTQANIWTEAIPTTARLDYLTMPRMTALAEVAWNREKDWYDFTTRVSNHFSRWDVMGIKYRLPDLPNLTKHVVFLDTARFKISIPEGVTEVRYTMDGSEPDSTSLLYKESFLLNETTTIKLLTLGYKKRSGNRYTLRFEKQNYLTAIDFKNSITGITCRYYEGEYNSVLKIDKKDLKKEFLTDTIGIPAIARMSVFALEFDAAIEIPQDGIYIFYLSSDDGSTLQIGDRMVVNNDGYHSGGEVSGQIALSKGYHPFHLKYFDGGGGNSLKVFYEGASIKKQSIPASTWKLLK